MLKKEDKNKQKEPMCTVQNFIQKKKKKKKHQKDK